MRTGVKTAGIAQDAATACPTEAGGADRPPNATLRHRCPRRRCTRAGAGRTSRPSGRPRPRRPRSTAALPGGPQRERADRRAEPGGDRSGADDDVRDLSPLPIGAANGEGAPPGSSTGRMAPALADRGRRGERPAARLDATIEPALVPTNRRQRRTSGPRIRPGRRSSTPRRAARPAEHEDVRWPAVEGSHQGSTGWALSGVLPWAERRDPHTGDRDPRRDADGRGAGCGSSSSIPALMPSQSTWVSGAVS